MNAFVMLAAMTLVTETEVDRARAVVVRAPRRANVNVVLAAPIRQPAAIVVRNGLFGSTTIVR